MTRSANPDPRPWERRAVRVGDWRITALSDGAFRLDGGAMWGIVPAAIWRPLTPPAPDNTIPLALRPFLLERGDLRVVLEVGIGDRWSEKLRRIYHIDGRETLEGTLAACGIAAEEVTHVIASHCHWDHIGAMVVERDGELVPRFPNARHHAPRAEIAGALAPDGARAGSYRAEDVACLVQRDMIEPYEGTVDLLPGLRAHVVGGHSEGVALVTIGEDGDGDTAVFWNDVVPTTHHIQPPYIMAYDADATRSFDARSEWIGRAADEQWIGLFYHDVDEAFGRIERDGRRYRFASVPSETLPVES